MLIFSYKIWNISPMIVIPC